jgi:LmbE family N-acetylglucosaminyl deacetylase
MNPVILSILAHPDDAEFLCAGSLIRLGREHGWQVYIASMTPGDCGSVDRCAEEIATIRRQEGQCAAASIGAAYYCLEERDLLIFYCERTLEKVARLLRTVQPSIVLTHSPADYMLDHEVTSTIVRAAVFGAPIPNFLAERGIGEPLPHIPHLYYCDPIEGKDALGREIEPDFCVDISAVMDDKSAMLACHMSQRDWLMQHHGMDQYILAMKEWSARRGQRLGTHFGEGFRQHRGHSYPQDNLLGQLLGGG